MASRRRRRGGFTLLEAMLAIIIVGVGVSASMNLFAACSRSNLMATNMTAAMLLAQNIQESMAGLPLTDPAFGKTYFGPEPGQTLSSYDDVDDFDGRTFNPPIDSTRAPIAQLSAFSQVVSVWPVQPNKLSINSNPSAPDLSQTTYTGAARVTVIVLYKKSASDPAVEVYRTSWIRVAD